MSTYPRMERNSNGSHYCHDCRKVVILFDDDTHMCHEGLSAAMEFDHVVTVTADGHVVDGPRNIYAPDLIDGELSGDGWEFFSTGYTRQDGYRGPIMHNSEFIGGQLADDILDTPGTYAAVVAAYTPDDDDDEMIWEGWAIVRYAEDDD